MSAALVRQALEFVDQEESVGKHQNRRAKRPGSAGQERKHPYKRTNKKKKEEKESDEEKIKKLLALSRPTTDKTTAEKIIQRTIKGKPLIDKIEVKRDDGKSILFADEEPEQKVDEGEKSS